VMPFLPRHKTVMQRYCEHDKALAWCSG
jgi:hypothetical protein